MTEDEIKKQIFSSLKQIAPDTEPSELSPDENIKESLGMDSFDFLQFIVSLDEKFKLEIPEKDYGKINKLASLVSYLSQRIT